jgi:excinuclease UvrABC nuclease subunit
MVAALNTFTEPRLQGVVRASANMIASAYIDSSRRECEVSGIDVVPNAPAVFLIWAEEGAPYLARTALLRRRLKRLAGERERPSRLLNLHGVARRIEYWLCGSLLESTVVLYALARRHFPEHYSKIVKLRMPAYVKLTLSNQFPRTLVTTRLTGGRAVYFGPFQTRVAAEQFDSQALDLFQVRRCQDNLEPRPDHPGCIYGEMGMCLRPCQAAVGVEEYAAEAARLAQFFTTGGASLLETTRSARERSSEELDFESAARLHKRYERIQQVLSLRDALVRDIDRINGVAITPAPTLGEVILWFIFGGAWTEPVQLRVSAPEGEIVSMDRRLREIATQLSPPCVSFTERQEHLAILSKWYYSSWRDGEWIDFESIDKMPYRRLVNAISRAAKQNL